MNVSKFNINIKYLLRHMKGVTNMPNKDGAINPIQKGARRQNLHDKQDNLGGNHKTKPEYTNFEGKPID